MGRRTRGVRGPALTLGPNRGGYSVCTTDNRELQRQRAVRDFLRQHPEEAAAYATLKHELAITYASDRSGYSNAKTDFIESILRQTAPDLL